MDTVYGYLERITYYNEENNFIVARLQEKGQKELTTITGNLAGINPGESLRLKGRWVNNPKYGRQFVVEQYETVVPATVNGMEKYMGSGLIKGIGPVMAKRIVKVFGLDTFDVIEGRPGELSRVEGIGTKRIDMITRAWEEQKEVKEIMVFLQQHGVSAAYSAKIYKKYGNESISVVKNNPYRLAADIYGIGFITADRIAQNMGISPDALIRVEEGLVYVINELMGEGHVYFPRELLLNQAAGMLKVERNIVETALAGLLEQKRLVLEPPLGQETEEEQAIYLAPFYIAETNLAARLLDLQEQPRTCRQVDADKAIAWVEEKLQAKLAEKQQEAVQLSTSSKVLIITGGPGTGKTTITRAIIRIFRALQLRVLLTAPTGRAAKRMQEATGYEAKTIHRLLEYNPFGGGCQKNQENPLEADVVIVDETSMIDTLLMYNLLKAIPGPATLILVGDTNQLPSVGPGRVLQDLIESGQFPVVTLTEIFRQAQSSKIVLNAHLINQGKFPKTRQEPGETTDFYFIEEENPVVAVNKILILCRDRIPKRFGHHPVRDIQVLTPMHRGDLGVANLNARLQEVLNPQQTKITRGYKTFKVNDKVMHLTNNYHKEVFNGDMGRVTAINQEDQELQVDFDGRLVAYEFSELDELTPAYAISIHKSQGSEYPAVVIPVVTQHYMLLQRNLIYTGITRGKELVVLIGTPKAMAMAIGNNKQQSRYTRLRDRLGVRGTRLL